MKFASFVVLEGSLVGYVRVAPLDWCENHAIGEVKVRAGDHCLRLPDVEIDVPEHDELETMIEAFREQRVQRRLAELEKEMAELKGAA